MISMECIFLEITILMFIVNLLQLLIFPPRVKCQFCRQRCYAALHGSVVVELTSFVPKSQRRLPEPEPTQKVESEKKKNDHGLRTQGQGYRLSEDLNVARLAPASTSRPNPVREENSELTETCISETKTRSKKNKANTNYRKYRKMKYKEKLSLSGIERW